MLCTRGDRALFAQSTQRKIDLADSVLVINVDGYVGPPPKSEIAYAIARGVPVEYLESVG